MKSGRGKIILLVLIGLAVALGLAFRNPIRRWYKAQYLAHDVSKGRFQNNEALAIDSEGTLYVGNQDTGFLVVIDRKGNTLFNFNTVDGYHDGDGNPDHITRGNNMVAVAPRRLVLVGRHNLAELDLTGDKPRLVRIIGSRGSAPGQMDGPEGLCRDDSNGDLYATDEHNRRINIFDKDGTFLRFFEVPQDPQTVRVWKDRVYVTLNKRNYIACYDKSGKELFRIGREALFPLYCWIGVPLAVVVFVVLVSLRKSRAALWATAGVLVALGGACLEDYIYHRGPGQFRLPDYMLVSRDGTSLYITDRLNARIQVTDMEGKYKFMIGSSGREAGQFRDPKDLGWDAEGNLVVCDSDNNRLQVFTPGGKFLRTIE